MKTIENRGASKVLVELTTLDLANLIGFLNLMASVKAVEEVSENDTKSSLDIFESYCTTIGGATLMLIECLEDKKNTQKVYKVDNEEYVFLLSMQK